LGLAWLPYDAVNAFYNNAVCVDTENNGATTALVLTGGDDDFVAFTNLIHLAASL